MLANALAYAARGWRVVPVHEITNGVCSCREGARCTKPGKHPRIHNWTESASSDAVDIRNWLKRWPSTNIGVVWGNGHIDIEVDLHDNGDVTMAALEKRLGKLPKTFTWRSGSGGLHRVYRAGDDIATGIKKLGPGVDVLGDGRQAVMPPSRHYSGKCYKMVHDVDPVKLPKAWVEELGTNESCKRAGKREGDLLDRDNQATIGEAERLLARVPADDYDIWLKVGMALRDQWRDTEDEELAKGVWERWASKSPKFTDKETSSRWESFNRSGTTFATVRWLAKEHGGSARAPAQEKGEAQADSAAARKGALRALHKVGTWYDVKKITRGLRGIELTKDHQDDIVRALMRVAKLQHESLSRREALDMIAFDRGGWYLDRADKLGWVHDLYLQTGAQPKILEIHNGHMTEHTRESFNSANGWKLASSEDSGVGGHEKEGDENGSRGGGKVSAVAEPWDVVVNLVMNGKPVLPRVDGYGYKPGAARLFRTSSYQLLANTWREWDAGTNSLLWTEREERDVAMWRDHIQWLVGEDEAKLLLQFLAWPIQRPTQRVRWCYAVLGPEGTGKSMLVHCMLREALGSGNVSIVGPSDLASAQYNSWMNGGVVGCIDELHVDTDTRHEFAIVNALKPALTDGVLRINGKYRVSVELDNVTTWFATSNFVVPFRIQGEAGRRWYFARTRVQSGDQLTAQLGGPQRRDRHFALLAQAARRSRDAIRGWLMSVDISDFPANRAPDCAHMLGMLESSADPMTKHLDAALEGDDQFINARVVGSKYLMAKLLGMDTAELRFSERVLARKLLERGYNLAVQHNDPWYGKKGNRKTSWYLKGELKTKKFYEKVRSAVHETNCSI